MFSYLTLRVEADPIRGWAGGLSVGFHVTVEGLWLNKEA